MPTSAPASSSYLNLSLSQRLALGTRLTQLREARKLSQLEVAKQALGLDISHAAVSRLERGVLDKVGPARLTALATFFGHTYDELLAEVSVPTEETPEEDARELELIDVAPGAGLRLQNLRNAAGLTTRELATKMGFLTLSGGVLIRNWELERIPVQGHTLLNIATTLGVSATWLITGRRAKPVRPTLSMRLSAMRKMHNLSYQELANLAELDLSTGRQTVHRYATKPPGEVSADVIKALADVFDVPASWLSPPTASRGLQVAAPAAESFPLPEGLSRKAKGFLLEIAELFSIGTLDEAEIGAMRSALMKQKMTDLRKACARPRRAVAA